MAILILQLKENSKYQKLIEHKSDLKNNRIDNSWNPNSQPQWPSINLVLRHKTVL